MNLNGFYRGVVEDNKDPEKRGRVRARIWGLHTAQKEKKDGEGIPTEELPWAEPVLPIFGGGVTGAGFWAVPVQGSHVCCFFENGHLKQLRYFGVMPGIPRSEADIAKGFNDPDGVMPRKDRLGEPDYHRLARGVPEVTLVEEKNKRKIAGIPTAGGGSFSEPNSPYAAEYPYNFVMATERGLAVEIDSTPGSERIHLFHPTGSYIEIGPDGTLVIRSAMRIDVVQGTHNDGATEDRNISAQGQVNIYGGSQVTIKGGIIRLNE